MMSHVLTSLYLWYTYSLAKWFLMTCAVGRGRGGGGVRACV
jgi:hypothetical protein